MVAVYLSNLPQFLGHSSFPTSVNGGISDTDLRYFVNGTPDWEVSVKVFGAKLDSS